MSEQQMNTETEQPEDPNVATTEEMEAGDQAQVMAEEVSRWRDLAVRTAADFDNFRKRVAREREEAVRFGNQDLLEQLIPILDNFEMGMLAASSDTSSMIYIGLDMVRKQFNEFLAQQGVEEIAALHAAFDPNLHEAVSEEETIEHAAGTVVRVLRRGFRLRDRLLRPANVVVAKAKVESAE
ncbi:MAG: nucleotide exchange factor GrpE [Akkermansiaceae bacterium]|jgi:molecular chaperone GrpE